ncbi:predicted protein [Arabidopsis lyrata subsp. lyrata]|uniref:Predicted protein n=1 Tax=Arabidopsis lyrata subsp. lyrata TaxID=81972 RepID=D7LB28_ARALL|nr:predicted protein [Arabidopsis lyrata subsp. lyrata]
MGLLSLNRRSGCWRLRRKLVVLQWVFVVWRGAQRGKGSEGLGELRLLDSLYFLIPPPQLKSYDSGISAISPGEKKKESLPQNRFVKVAGFPGELWWVGASAGKELGQKQVSSVYGS